MIFHTEFHSKKALRGGCHRAVQKAEHCHNSGNGSISAIIRRAQHVQEHPQGIELNEHNKQHPEIEERGVFGDTGFVNGGGGHGGD